jgi:hypothetical protein
VWDIGEKTIGELTEMVNKSELALPQFQRPVVWGKSNWIPFLVTVLLGRPTGTLLFMQASEAEALAPRPIETAPKLKAKSLKWLLLDGQQRMTTLYRAAYTEFGKTPQLKKIVLDVKSAINAGELAEEHVSVDPAGKVPASTEMALSGKVCFATLIDDEDLELWRSAFAAEHFGGDGAKFISAVKDAIPGLLKVKDYRFPVLEIHDDTPLHVVADIFEGMNRRGQPLNKFDLMVARLYRPLPDGKYFDLRDNWLSALGGSASLRHLGVGVDDGMLPLQLLAKQLSRLPASLRGGRVKGLNGSDVLELPSLAGDR